jgi:transglutaminase-like putative cysteine protease
MRIRVGYELIYECPQPTPMILMLAVHASRVPDLIVPDHMVTDPPVAITPYRDMFGNWCSRILAPPGRLRITANGVVNDSGLPDPVVPEARQNPVQDLPEECLTFLLPSRYCDIDRLDKIAEALFAPTKPGWARVQAICDFVHRHVTFGYHHARHTKSAWDAYTERTGVCRDFAHLAISFCRCMNIPARYCTGYLGDFGVTPPPGEPMDFSAWIEAYIGGQWHAFDPRYNVPRIGKVLIARGRDAADVAISTTFAPNKLTKFTVWTDEVKAEAGTNTASAPIPT